MSSPLYIAFFDELAKVGMCVVSCGQEAIDQKRRAMQKIAYSTKGHPMIGLIYNAFADELEKVAKKKSWSFQRFVHHPLTQAFGYGALAAEGAHALAEMSKRPRLRRAARSKWGTLAGKGAIGAGATFLALEGMSALMDYFRKKTASPGAPKGHPDFKTFKKHKVTLTPEERAEVLKRKAVWHFNGGSPSPAVGKAVIDGKTWYETHTHRAINYAPTLKGAINRYHKFIKSTA